MIVEKTLRSGPMIVETDTKRFDCTVGAGGDGIAIRMDNQDLCHLGSSGKEQQLVCQGAPLKDEANI
jgi:hypothetical protein